MLDNRDTLDKLFGVAGMFPYKRSNFFSPCQLDKDFGLRAASVVTAPILLSAVTITNLLTASVELLKGFTNLLMFNFSDAKDNFLGAGRTLLVLSPIILIMAILSPLVNLIDLIGGVINRIRGAEQTPQEENMVMNRS